MKIYFIDSSTAIKYFSIDSHTGIVKIKKRIDLESSEVGGKLGGLFEFTVRAIEIGDENSTRTTQVIVSISDINDNEPRFSKPLIHLNLLPTQASAGSTLTLVEDDIDSIRAFDPDKVKKYLFKDQNLSLL